MTYKKQLGIIKKDVKSVILNKQLFLTMLILPVVFSVVIPTVFVLSTLLSPGDSKDFAQMLELLGSAVEGENPQEMLLGLVLNYVLPIFFLLIPIFVSSIMAASSFVGEREKKTLETLCYSPMTITEIFQAKVWASFAIGMLFSLGSFLLLFVVLEAELMAITGTPMLPEVSWIFVLLLISPALSLVTIALMVRESAKAKTVEEAQQKAGFLVIPFILLLVGQFAGLFLISNWLLLLLGVVLSVLAGALLKSSMHTFDYEKLL